jgi:phospholipid/cholesterol/gamma-HCH transport system substrate-binding protein
MNMRARCAEPASQSNARGAQHAPRPRAAADYESPVVAYVDRSTGEVLWGDDVPAELRTLGTVAPKTFGEESWKWLFLQPMT